MFKDAEEQYVAGDSEVVVSFRSANPRNNQRLEGTFLTVDQLAGDGKWTTKYVDGDWCTKFYWKGGAGSFGVSFAEITWKIPQATTQGLYRVCHYGTRKTFISSWAELMWRLPDSLLSNCFGSLSVGLGLQVSRIAVSITKAIDKVANAIYHAKYRDFEGCSRTFLVKAAQS